MTPEQLRTALDNRGYDVEKLDDLSAQLKVDLVLILANWQPVLAALDHPARFAVAASVVEAQPAASPNVLRRRGWLRRLFDRLYAYLERNAYA